jgi:hypothetical protein
MIAHLGPVLALMLFHSCNVCEALSNYGPSFRLGITLLHVDHAVPIRTAVA